jgi:hypothetical protein
MASNRVDAVVASVLTSVVLFNERSGSVDKRETFGGEEERDEKGSVGDIPSYYMPPLNHFS